MVHCPESNLKLSAVRVVELHYTKGSESEMPLRNLAFTFQYRSDRHVLSRDLYEKCLPQSALFLRAIGFFASSVFGACPKAFHSFFSSQGLMRVVSSPILSREDIESIQRGHRDRPALIRKPCLEILNGSFGEIRSQVGDLLAWLVASGRFDLKIAVLNTSSGRIYHEKLGIFQDELNHQVAFSGSANESLAALSGNFEVVDLFRSWIDQEDRRVARKRADFDALWSNETSGLDVYSFPEAARLGLLRVREDSETEVAEKETLLLYSGPLSGLEETLGIPSDLTLREHQMQGVREWFRNSCRGILEMATGSGKTLTALAAAAKLYEQIGPPLLIVVVCPYKHLVTQWVEEAQRFGLDPLPCMISKYKWQDELSTRLYNNSVGTRLLASIITTTATFSSALFQQMLQKYSLPLLLIVDEVHNMGAEELRNALLPSASFRLGLSATPERWFDPIGTTALTDYFGPTLVHYTLKKALQDGVLCQYRYYPVLVQLTDEEFDEYYDLTVKIARLFANLGTPNDQSQRLESLLIRRARLIGTARMKLDTLRDLISPLSRSTHNLVYCGDGSIETLAEQSISRQIDAVTRLLGLELGMTVAKYVADTALSRRDSLRREFGTGDIQCLVAIRCLDEGVDIPETRRAFILASSTNPRQFIQRRGRLLRTSPGKEMAEIYDFVVEPPTEFTTSSSQYYSITRRLFGKELSRVVEFAGLAVNGPEALGQLLELRNRMNLLDLEGDE